jgi:hypothetical protein
LEQIEENSRNCCGLVEVEHKMAEIISVTLRTGSCLVEAAAIVSTVGYAAANDATKK